MPKFITITAEIPATANPFTDHDAMIALKPAVDQLKSALTHMGHKEVVTVGYMTRKAKVAAPPVPIENAMTLAATDRVPDSHVKPRAGD